MKKAFKFIKRTLVVIFLSILVLSAAVVFFKNEIKELCLKNMQQVLNTDVVIGSAQIRFLESFPKVTLEITNLSVKDAIKGSNDSLMVLKRVSLGFDVKKLFYGEFQINSCLLENGYVHLKIDDDGQHNYAIFKTSKEKQTTPFSIKIDRLELTNVELNYIDQRIQNNLLIHAHHAVCALNHQNEIIDISLDGDFDCHFLGIKGEKYLQEKPFSINTSFLYDLTYQKLVLNESDLKLENAKFKLDGSIEFAEFTQWDLKLSSPNTDVQSLISLLPHKLSKELSAYKSSGKLYFSGKIEGIQSANESPLVEVDFGFEDASFYHPDLEQRITNSKLKGSFTNGSMHNKQTTVLSLKNFSGYLGKDLIMGNLIISNFNDPYLDVDLVGKFDVASALRLFPIQKIKSASGKVEADVNFKGKLSHLTDISKTQYIKTSGKFMVKDLNFQLDSVGVDFTGFNGMFYFDKHDLGISKLAGKVGKSDFILKGFFKNFIAYVLLDKEVLKIQADLTSDFIDVNEILSQGMNQSNTATDTKSNNQAYSFHLSPFLAYDLQCHVKHIEFRRLSGQNAGKNLSGKLQLRDRLLHYQNLSLEFASGKVQMNGVINATDTSAIVVRNQTKIENLDVKKAFYVLENFGQEFITDKNLDGSISASLETLMKFNSKLDLDINSVNSMVELKIVNGTLINFEPMQEMGSFLKKKAYAKYLKSNDFDHVSFSELKNTIYISKGVIEIPEMLVISDLASDLTIKGEHSFDNKINYRVNFPLINFKREERLESKGVVLDSQKRMRLHLSIIGDVENYKISVDENLLLKSAVSVATERVTELFEEDKPEVISLDTTNEMENMIFDEL